MANAEREAVARAEREAELRREQARTELERVRAGWTAASPASHNSPAAAPAASSFRADAGAEARREAARAELERARASWSTRPLDAPAPGDSVAIAPTHSSAALAHLETPAAATAEAIKASVEAPRTDPLADVAHGPVVATKDHIVIRKDPVLASVPVSTQRSSRRGSFARFAGLTVATAIALAAVCAWLGFAPSLETAPTLATAVEVAPVRPETQTTTGVAAKPITATSESKEAQRPLLPPTATSSMVLTSPVVSESPTLRITNHGTDAPRARPVPAVQLGSSRPEPSPTTTSSIAKPTDLAPRPPREDARAPTTEPQPEKVSAPKSIARSRTPAQALVGPPAPPVTAEKPPAKAQPEDDWRRRVMQP